MADWFDEQASVISRQVEDLEWEGRPSRAVIAVRSYPTDVTDLWDAITDAERIPRWFLPITGELKLGGRYQLQGNAGGTIERCEPPHVLGVTWEFGGGTSWVTIELAAEGADSARLTLRHICPIDEKTEEFWDQFGPGAVGVGWDLGLLGLAMYLRSGQPVPREEDFMKSDEGRRVTGLSNEGWHQASAAYGTDPDAASAAAARTLAFYTGDGPDSGG